MLGDLFKTSGEPMGNSQFPEIINIELEGM